MCGVFGAVNKADPVASDLYVGLYALQTRGKQSAGIVTYNGKRYLGKKYFGCIGMGEIPQIFSKKKLSKLPGRIGIAHTKYSTPAGIDSENAQSIQGFWRKPPFNSLRRQTR